MIHCSFCSNYTEIFELWLTDIFGLTDIIRQFYGNYTDISRQFSDFKFLHANLHTIRMQIAFNLLHWECNTFNEGTFRLFKHSVTSVDFCVEIALGIYFLKFCYRNHIHSFPAVAVRQILSSISPKNFITWYDGNWAKILLKGTTNFEA